MSLWLRSEDSNSHRFHPKSGRKLSKCLASHCTNSYNLLTCLIIASPSRHLRHREGGKTINRKITQHYWVKTPPHPNPLPRWGEGRVRGKGGFSPVTSISPAGGLIREPAVEFLKVPRGIDARNRSGQRSHDPILHVVGTCFKWIPPFSEVAPATGEAHQVAARWEAFGAILRPPRPF